MRQKEQTAIKNKRGKKEQTRVGESSKGLTRMHIFFGFIRVALTKVSGEVQPGKGIRIFSSLHHNHFHQIWQKFKQGGFLDTFDA